MDRTADEGAFQPVLQDVFHQLPAGAGLEAEIDLGKIGDELREKGVRRKAAVVSSEPMTRLPLGRPSSPIAPRRLVDQPGNPDGEGQQLLAGRR